ncbi:MAG TPA: bifunctional phosphopantothenoylcysteine decarboxylase/phosphopantothenate--cysteine ligase CoaBC [Gemmatimonadaceae bacterium]|nr:bifunctional phosphopantothenoylcysteine decarboxylase/phosphopantothenate--cysteine ligase CoaBC [Gemmatimonadaceae bacterium]
MSSRSAPSHGVATARPFDGTRILLGVTGGIASYKSVWLARLLTQAGAEVDVVMTRGAREFVGPITFEAVTGRPVYTEIFGPGHALDHIKLAREAAVIVVAPATADFVGRAAHGLADDLLTACLLAATGRILLVPAMNDRMWAHMQTQRNVEQARSLGYEILEPDEGPLAVGEGSGPGRMPEPETIVSHLGRLLERQSSLRGRKIIVTAGATREQIDPVRFISNHSSGKMGVALARAAWRRGAEVVLIAGHVDVAVPPEIGATRIETVDEMAKAVGEALPSADVLIMAAAPADFRPAEQVDQKIKKGKTAPQIALEPTLDILKSTIPKRKKKSVIVGFALETNDGAKNAREKLESKQLDFVVLNNATEPGAGFGVDTNRVTIIDRNGKEQPLELMPKSAVAEIILDCVEAALSER